MAGPLAKLAYPTTPLTLTLHTVFTLQLKTQMMAVFMSSHSVQFGVCCITVVAPCISLPDASPDCLFTDENRIR